MLPDNSVAVVSHKGSCVYPVNPPFRPHGSYPELTGYVAAGAEPNIIYPLWRQLARELRMDLEHYSTPAWNPFRALIRPGDKVLIKPSLVNDLTAPGRDLSAIVTHGSLVRCILDYVGLALQGRGEITVGDAPIQGANFARVMQRTGMLEVCRDVADTWHVPVRVLDFRLWAVRLDRSGRIVGGRALKGDPAGYCAVDLGQRSLLSPLGAQSHKFRVTMYDPHEMLKHHNKSRNEYLIPRTVLEADAIINLPKLKTHRKVGLTAALKNIVGINGQKDWLPHHRVGSLDEGGDEYLRSSFLKKTRTRLLERIDQAPLSPLNPLWQLMASVVSRLARCIAADPFLEGSWYGNDTLWRTVLDLNRLLAYADTKGTMTVTRQRKWLTVVDGIVAGEGEGPLHPDPRACGLLVGGMNPVAVDAALATIAGFDFRNIPLIAKAFELRDWPLVNFAPHEIRVRSPNGRWDSVKIGEPCASLRLTPASGWLGHVELPWFKAR